MDEHVQLFDIQRYQNVINQGGHPIALVSMDTTLWEKSLFRDWRHFQNNKVRFSKPNLIFGNVHAKLEVYSWKSSIRIFDRQTERLFSVFNLFIEGALLSPWRQSIVKCTMASESYNLAAPKLSKRGGGGVTEEKTYPAFAIVCTARQYNHDSSALAVCQWVFVSVWSGCESNSASTSAELDYSIDV